MRKLTFIGFLTGYIQNLSSVPNFRIALLYEECKSNLRLREPLFLYAYHNDKSHILKKYLSDEDLKEYKEISYLLDSNRIDELPKEYKKVYNSYEVKTHMKDNDDNIKKLMLDKIIRLKSEKNISNYRIYTDLRLNPGNFNAFIKNRNIKKLSLSNTRETLNYLEAI